MISSRLYAAPAPLPTLPLMLLSSGKKLAKNAMPIRGWCPNDLEEHGIYLPLARLPISNKNTEMKKAVFKGKYLYAFPHHDWKAASVKKKADPYHPIWSRLSNSLVIRGIAVATIVCCLSGTVFCMERSFRGLNHQIKGNLHMFGQWMLLQGRLLQGSRTRNMAIKSAMRIKDRASCPGYSGPSTIDMTFSFCPVFDGDSVLANGKSESVLTNDCTLCDSGGVFPALSVGEGGRINSTMIR